MRCSISSGQIEFGDFATFGEAAAGVMDMLHELHGLDAWFITRIRLDEWIVTHLRGESPFARGDALPVTLGTREQIISERTPSGRTPSANSKPSAAGPA